jgi:predicted RNase H-like nuclease
MDEAWAGVDAGKEFHWAHVLDTSGTELLSRKVQNDEADILRLIDDALSLAEEVLWAIDQRLGVARRSCWPFCGNVIRKCFTSQVSAWIAPATPTAGSPKRCP